jgi:hypothetical protein
VALRTKQIGKMMKVMNKLKAIQAAKDQLKVTIIGSQTVADVTRNKGRADISYAYTGEGKLFESVDLTSNFWYDHTYYVSVPWIIPYCKCAVDFACRPPPPHPPPPPPFFPSLSSWTFFN